MPQKAFSSSQGTEGIMNSLRQNANTTGSAHNNEQMEADRAIRSSCYIDGSNRNQNDVSGKECLSERQDVANRTIDVAVGTKTDNDEKVEISEQLNPWDRASRGNSLEGAQYGSFAADMVEAPNNQENKNNNGTMNRPPPTLRASLPQWTNEQLDELFAFD